MYKQCPKLFTTLDSVCKRTRCRLWCGIASTERPNVKCALGSGNVSEIRPDFNQQKCNCNGAVIFHGKIRIILKVPFFLTLYQHVYISIVMYKIALYPMHTQYNSAAVQWSIVPITIIVCVAWVGFYAAGWQYSDLR